MTVRTIFQYPDERLREVAEPVGVVDDEVRALVEDLAETMYHAKGVGLAATQIGVAKRVFVIDIANDDEPSDLKVFINPEILETGGSVTFNEGCLSFPGITEEVKRADTLTVRALDASGTPFVLEAEGLLAIAVQHETDHLNGVLMIDKLGSIKRRLVARKLGKRRSSEPAAL